MLRRTGLSVAALAAATLLLESTLTRLLAVAQFYHFAFLVVSLALLGFGASGSLLSLAPRLTRQAPVRLVAWCGGAFALATGLAYAAVNLLPFDSYSIAWDRRQIAYFVLYYLALTLPFLCAGVGIGAALAGSSGRSHLIYAANLLGSAAGALLAPLLLALAGVPGAVLGSGLIAILPLVIGGNEKAATNRRENVHRVVRRALAGAGAVGLVGLIVLSVLNLSGRGFLGLTLSPYKGLAYAQRYPGSTALFGCWNAISRVDVLGDAGTHLLPGLSYTYDGPPPHQIGLSVDGDSMAPIPLTEPEAFSAAAFLPEAIALQIRPKSQALVLESAGGLGVSQALAGGAEQVTVVLSNPLVRQAVAQANPMTDPYASSRVRIVADPARVHLRRDATAYDLIFLPLTDAYRPVASGAYSLAETYGLTVEALAAALARLAPDGILVVTRWLQTPPSEDLRLWATLIEALERSGADPGGALVVYRGIQTATALAQPDGWSVEELATVRSFAVARRYDLVWAPDITPDEANRFNRMPAAEHYEAMAELLAVSERADFYRDWPYAVTPPTDDRPFFFHFFRWSQTPQVLATLGRTWQPFGGSGYLVLFALLMLVLVLSGLLIVAPLALRHGELRTQSHQGDSRPQNDYSQRQPPEPRERWRVMAYFGSLGLAFLFVEIPLIQRWLLATGHAIYAFTLVVLVLLLGSSLGSLLARSAWLPRRASLIALVLLVLLTAFAGSRLVGAALGWPTQWRIAAAAASLAPLAVLMGLPFPLGLGWLEARAPRWVPWAWAVNGCTSVIASVLAAILALSFGFTVVMCLGAGAYAFALLLLPVDQHFLPQAKTSMRPC